MLSDETTEMGVFNPAIAKPRENAKAIFKTYEGFIYGYIHYITDLFSKKVQNIATH
jgi:hypothetical protein